IAQAVRTFEKLEQQPGTNLIEDSSTAVATTNEETRETLSTEEETSETEDKKVVHKKSGKGGKHSGCNKHHKRAKKALYEGKPGKAQKHFSKLHKCARKHKFLEKSGKKGKKACKHHKKNAKKAKAKGKK